MRSSRTDMKYKRHRCFTRRIETSVPVIQSERRMQKETSYGLICIPVRRIEPSSAISSHIPVVTSTGHPTTAPSVQMHNDMCDTNHPVPLCTPPTNAPTPSPRFVGLELTRRRSCCVVRRDAWISNTRYRRLFGLAFFFIPFSSNAYTMSLPCLGGNLTSIDAFRTIAIHVYSSHLPHHRTLDTQISAPSRYISINSPIAIGMGDIGWVGVFKTSGLWSSFRVCFLIENSCIGIDVTFQEPEECPLLRSDTVYIHTNVV